MDYSPPIKEMSFIVKELLGLESVSVLPGYEEATSETFDLILAESARFTTQVLAPLNAKGDRHGAHLEGGDVKTPPGFKEAYEKFLEGGWNGLTAPPVVWWTGITHVTGGASGRNVACGQYGLHLGASVNPWCCRGDQLCGYR